MDLDSTIGGASSATASLDNTVLMATVIVGSSVANATVHGGISTEARIKGHASLSGVVTVLHHRTLVMSVNVGAYADKAFSTTATAVSGPGMRQAGQLQEQIRQQTANYV
jgi:hypothetical protein